MKRVELTAVPTPQKQKKVKWKQSTHRFVLNLGESNSETCPEYSFADLVKNDKPLNGNPFDEPDDDRDVAAIAQRFEAKYGPKTLFSGKRKRTQEMDDYYDPGEGYDEDDPFIDNTEAHDEVVPSTLTTQHGGFYINQGKLDFKCLDEDSSDEFTNTQVMKKKKRRILDSESDEETGAALAKKFKAMKRKRQLESREGEKEKKKKKHSSADDGELILKKKKIKRLDKLKLSKLVQEPLSQKETVTSSLLSVGTVNTPILAPSPIAATTPSRITTMANGAVGDACETTGVHELTEEICNMPEAMKDDLSSKSGDEGKGDNQPSDKNTLLPTHLPPELLEAIENIKREAKDTKEKKIKFFSDDVNKLLLDIELGSRSLAWGSRTAIYNHLGEHLPCGKPALQRRAKKLRESKEDGQLKTPIHKLKEAILKVMPGLEEQHELDVQRAKMESELKEETADGKEEASTESEGEDKSDNRKKPRGPRRKFKWNSEMRDLLLHIVSTKIKLFGICKSRNQTAEEYLKTFLDSDLKPLWPQGWMQTRMLFKESRQAHEDLTKSVLQQGKQRKASSSIETAASTVENIRSHTSRTEDVIEISSNMESDEDNKSVVLNISNSDVEPLAPLSQACSATLPGILPSSTGQVSKQSFKATTASVPVSNPSPSATTTLTHKAAEDSTISSVKRVIPVPVTESPPMTTAKGTVTTKPFIPVVPPNATPPPGAPGSNATQSSIPQQKLNLQQKLVSTQQIVNIQQQKLPQELQKVANMQQNKAAIRSSQCVVVNKDAPNSSWTNVNSIVPNNKFINPVVAVNRIPEAHAQKLSMGSKNNHTIMQQSQKLLPQGQQQEKVLNNTVVKPNQTYIKQQRSGASSPSTVGGSSDPQHVSKLKSLPQSGAMSSKQDQPIRTSVQQHEGQQKTSTFPNPQLKSGIVIGTSPNSVQKFNQQHVKTGNVIGTGTLPPLSVRTAFDSPGWNHHSGAANARQPSPPGKLASSVTSFRSSSSAASPPSSTSASLLNISSTPLSRSSTPSPQKSPVSPEGNAALSLYEQIKSQIRHQEAMEDQALKNLALALKFGGSNSSNFFGGDVNSQ